METSSADYMTYKKMFFKPFYRSENKAANIKSRRMSALAKLNSRLTITKVFKFRSKAYQTKFQTKLSNEINTLINLKAKVSSLTSTLLESSIGDQRLIKILALQKQIEQKKDEFHQLYDKKIFFSKDVVKVIDILSFKKTKVSENLSTLLQQNMTLTFENITVRERLNLIKEKSVKNFMGLCSAAAVYKDNLKIVLGSSDSTIRIIKIPQGKVIKVLLGHKLFISSLIFYDDFKYLISTSYDSKIIVWDFKKGKIKKIINEDGHYIMSADLLDDSYIVGRNNGLITIWRLPQWEIENKFNIYETINNIKFIDSNTFILRYNSKHVIFNRNQEIIHQFCVGQITNDFKISFNRRFLITTSSSCCQKINLYYPYSASTLTLQRTAKSSLVISRDDSLVIFAINVNTCFILDLYNFQTRSTASCNRNYPSIELLINSNDNNHIFAISSSGSIFDLNIQLMRDQRYEIQNVFMFKKLIFNVLNNYIYGISKNRILIVYDSIKKNYVIDENGANQIRVLYTDIELSSNNNILAAASFESFIHLYDASNFSNNPIYTITNIGYIYSFIFSCNNSLFIVGLDRGINVYNTSNYSTRCFLESPYDINTNVYKVLKLAITKDDSKLISIHRNLSSYYFIIIRIWSLTEYRSLASYTFGDGYMVMSLKHLENEKKLILALNSGKIQELYIDGSSRETLEDTNFEKHKKLLKNFNYIPYRS